MLSFETMSSLNTDGGLAAAERAVSESIRFQPSTAVVELQLSSVSFGDDDRAFPVRFGARVRALRGSFTECRGTTSTRFVVLPMNEAGLELAAECLAAFPDYRSTTVVFRFGGVALVRYILGRPATYQTSKPARTGVAFESAVAEAQGWAAGLWVAKAFQADDDLRAARARQRPLAERRVVELRAMLAKAEADLAAMGK
jgi:hypothetical protein